MKALEEDKNRMFKKEEEKEELKGLATQELAKVKHMVSLICITRNGRKIRQEFNKQKYVQPWSLLNKILCKA